MKALLDTHTAILLWEGRHEVFGVEATRVLETYTLLLSPFSRLEMKYLLEIGRIVVEPDLIVGGLEADCGVAMTSGAVADVIAHAMSLSWTRDPFDRLLVATAALQGTKFVTRDRTIRQHFVGAVW